MGKGDLQLPCSFLCRQLKLLESQSTFVVIHPTPVLQQLTHGVLVVQPSHR